MRPKARVSRDSSDTCAPKERAAPARSWASGRRARCGATAARHRPKEMTASTTAAPTSPGQAPERGSGNRKLAARQALAAPARVRLGQGVARSRTCSRISSPASSTVVAAPRANQPPRSARLTPSTKLTAVAVASPVLAAAPTTRRVAGRNRPVRSPGNPSHQATSKGRRNRGPRRRAGLRAANSPRQATPTISHPGSAAASPVAAGPALVSRPRCGKTSAARMAKARTEMYMSPSSAQGPRACRRVCWAVQATICSPVGKSATALTACPR